MKGINIHIYHSTFKNDTRIVKETASIKKSAFFEKIIILALWKKSLPEFELLDNGVEVHRVKALNNGRFNNKIIKAIDYPVFIIRAFVKYRSKSVKVVNCHGLPLIFFGLFMKWFYKSKLVLDAHELETERIGLKGFPKWVFKKIEKFSIPYLDLIIVVSNSIENWYRTTYNIDKVISVRNIPEKKQEYTNNTTVLKDKFNIPHNELLFIYQGVISKARNISMYLDVFSVLPSHFHIVFMGFGVDASLVQNYATQYSNIHFQEAVSPQQIADYTASADIGFNLAENLCLSYFYSLPNKFFEYIHSGVPPLVSNFPDMGSVIDKYDCGWYIDPNKENLYDFILNFNIQDLKRKKNNCLVCKTENVWENEAIQLNNAIQILIQQRG